MTDHSPTNADRASWAAQALTVFTTETFNGKAPGEMHPEDHKDAIGDLIADLLHWARLNDMDPAAIMTTAQGHFEFEEAHPDE